MSELNGQQRAVLIRGLVKSYGSVRAVRGLDLEIRRGEIFALLGPNGAGKTTTVEILEGYRRRDRGEVSVLGIDPGRQRSALKSRIGIVLQSTGVDQYLTVAETVRMYASYYPHPLPTDEVIGLVGLREKRDSRVIKLSGGQMRRLDVAIALAGDPELLFLDEPTTGFDPAFRPGNAGRPPWRRVQLDRRAHRRRVGPGRAAAGDPLLQLGAAHWLSRRDSATRLAMRRTHARYRLPDRSCPARRPGYRGLADPHRGLNDRWTWARGP